MRRSRVCAKWRIPNDITRDGSHEQIFGLYSATDEQMLTDFVAWRKKMGR
jgi:hypothetical protein